MTVVTSIGTYGASYAGTAGVNKVLGLDVPSGFPVLSNALQHPRQQFRSASSSNLVKCRHRFERLITIFDVVRRCKGTHTGYARILNFLLTSSELVPWNKRA